MSQTKQGRRNDPVKAVMTHVKNQLHTGELKPGDRLTSERRLAEELGISRSNIRAALQKLEFYGLIHTLPQSGSIIADIGSQSFDGLIEDVMTINEFDFFSLVESRLFLELEAIRLACQRSETEDITKLKAANAKYIKYEKSDKRVDHDMYFHRVIAQSSHNEVLKSMLLAITPGIMHHYDLENFCHSAEVVVIEEHKRMIEAIETGDSQKGEAVMRLHLDRLYTYARNKHKQSR